MKVFFTRHDEKNLYQTTRSYEMIIDFSMILIIDSSTLRIQSPSQMMSKGCIITSLERYLGSMKPQKVSQDP